MSQVKRHTVVLLGGIILFVLATAAINSWVNPLRVVRSPWSGAGFEDYRDISSQIRTGKAGLIRSTPQIDVAFLGSSRIENGLDPEHARWRGKEVLNLGCSGGYIHESAGITDYLLKNTQPAVLICGIDPGDLSRPTDSRNQSDYHSSPFSSTHGAIDRELRYIFGITSLEDSIDTIIRRSRSHPSSYTSKGLRTVESEGSQLRFIRRQLVGNAFAFGNQRRSAKIVPEKIQTLRGLMVQAREAGTRLILFIHPQHAIMAARLRDLEDPPLFFPDERPALVKLVEEVNSLPSPGPSVELWDFFDFHPINCESLPLGDKKRMTNWDDLGHFSVPVGNAIQARLMGWDVELDGAENYGFQLDATNLTERQDAIRAGYRRYLSGPHRSDVVWKEELIQPKPEDPEIR